MIHVGRVASRKHRGTRKLGLGDLVVEKHPTARDPVAGLDPRSEKPPLVPAEEHVRALDVPLDGGAGAVTVIGTHREGLRGDKAPKAALGGIALVVVEGVGILHSLGPTPNVIGTHGILHLASPQRNTDPGVDRTRVKFRLILFAHAGLLATAEGGTI